MLQKLPALQFYRHVEIFRFAVFLTVRGNDLLAGGIEKNNVVIS